MIDALRPRRRLLYRRLWRSRCCPVSERNHVKDDGVEEVLRQQKALVRQLTKILTTSQLDALADVVEQRVYYCLHACR